MRNLSLLLLSLVSIPALNGWAAEFDGAKPFLCATVDVASCVPGQDCVRESADTVNAPQFFTVDVEKKQVSSRDARGTTRTSKIDAAEHRSGLMLLSGTDGTEAWVAAVGETSGKLSYAVVGDRLGVMAFGACLNR
jgi:hypothetical protein